MYFCKNCLMPSTRPRLQFSKRGWCNACEWHEEKMTTVDWNQKRSKLADLCDVYRRTDGWFDVIVPCSGGKDGSYVAWNIKHNFHMNPLCITCRPLLPTRLGRINLENFILSGFDHFMLSPNPDKLREASKQGFIEQGRPWHAFDTIISTSIIQLALRFDIPFILYGEEGELEYGGAADAKQKIDHRYLLDYYYCGHDPSKYGMWWKCPSQADLDNLYLTHWSKFEDWDPQVHARHAKEHCGLQMLVGGNIGTFTNYACLDDAMRDLHVYLQFTKFGFGRCNADASIEIRRGRMTRQAGADVCKMIDGQFPMEYLPLYLDYFGMKEGEFWDVVERWTNFDILKRTGDIERPFKLKRKFENYDVFNDMET